MRPAEGGFPKDRERPVVPFHERVKRKLRPRHANFSAMTVEETLEIGASLRHDPRGRDDIEDAARARLEILSTWMET